MLRPCCSIADCQETHDRLEHDRYEALIGADWLAVPPDNVLQRTGNPNGRAILRWPPQIGVMCFLRPSEL